MNAIYLDHNATTPTRPEVVEVFARACAEGYANPASQHQTGQRARKVLEETRERTAALLGADLTCPRPDRLIFTSGGTEANNLAVLGITAGRPAWADENNEAERLDPSEIKMLVISSIEHQSVIEPAEFLLEQGWRLDTLPVDSNGVIQSFEPFLLVMPLTRLVSVIFANHETGVLQPIDKIARLCNSMEVPMHTDATQAVGKHPIDFRALGVSALSIAAHKFRGPLGIGALILRHDAALKPLMYGGHQQFGLRPGTESVPLALGMLTALELAEKERDEYVRRVSELRTRFETGLRAGFPEILVHGESAARLPNTANIAFPGIDGQILLLALDLAGVACSAGAACSSGSTELSPTLRAMGLPSEIVAASLRFSLGATTTAAEIDEAVSRILGVCREIRG
ncbi:MAG: cysteine desulfurase [Pirellulales bacterium]|nr:cysteine desulfurase [Pirellulales bacterium]